MFGAAAIAIAASQLSAYRATTLSLRLHRLEGMQKPPILTGPILLICAYCKRLVPQLNNCEGCGSPPCEKAGMPVGTPGRSFEECIFCEKIGRFSSGICPNCLALDFGE